jgi:hypothetical protein
MPSARSCVSTVVGRWAAFRLDLEAQAGERGSLLGAAGQPDVFGSSLGHALVEIAPGDKGERLLEPCPGDASTAVPNRDVPSLMQRARSSQRKRKLDTDVDQLIARRNKRGRPMIGNAPSNVESVRLDPELGRQQLQRAEA